MKTIRIKSGKRSSRGSHGVYHRLSAVRGVKYLKCQACRNGKQCRHCVDETKQEYLRMKAYWKVRTCLPCRTARPQGLANVVVKGPRMPYKALGLVMEHIPRGMPLGSEDLGGHDAFFPDVHSGNYRFKGKELVRIDLGRYDIPSQAVALFKAHRCYKGLI